MYAEKLVVLVNWMVSASMKINFSRFEGHKAVPDKFEKAAFDFGHFFKFQNSVLCFLALKSQYFLFL